MNNEQRHQYQCQNCDTPLQGHFCYNCGQEELNDTHFFGAVILDLLGTFFSYDSKVNRTLMPLLIKPGFLSNEYISGRPGQIYPSFQALPVCQCGLFFAFVYAG